MGIEVFKGEMIGANVYVRVGGRIEFSVIGGFKSCTSLFVPSARKNIFLRFKVFHFIGNDESIQLIAIFDLSAYNAEKLGVRQGLPQSEVKSAIFFR